MDIIDKALTSLPDPPYKYSPAICAALTIGKRTLSKYYNKTEESEVYCIVMSMLAPFLSLCTLHVSDHDNSSSPSPQDGVLQKEQVG